MVRVTTLRCNQLDSPLAVGPEAPSLSWRLEAAERGVLQERCRVRVASHADLVSTLPDVWDSGWLQTDAQSVTYQGPALISGQALHWTVEVETTGGAASSQSACFEVGLLTRADWHADWISLPRPTDQNDDHRPAPHLRREFRLPTAPTRARLYITAAGLYEASLNGVRVGDTELAPGWTDFRQRVHYQAYDVTAGLCAGENVLAVVIADGWFSGAVGPGARRGYYGTEPALLAHLDVDLTDGSRLHLGTDGSWQGAFGRVLAADLLMGQVEDARLDLGSWGSPGHDDRRFTTAGVVEGPAGTLQGQPCSGVQAVHELRAVGVHEAAPGSHIYDFGQNMVGRPRILIDVPAGTVLRARYGEMLGADGCLYTENLRVAKATDTYIAAGRPPEVWEPRFTFHGFRYLELTGLGRALALKDVTGIVLSSAGRMTGEFDCSDPLLRQLQSNIRWGQLGNFLEIPTDCPQRDERLGWGGDILAFAPTACFNADVGAFLGKWLADLVDAQSPEGAIPDVAPLPPHELAGLLTRGAPGWGDAGVVVPWTLYHCYGDPAVLRRAYRPATAWVDYVHRHNPDLLWQHSRGNDFGDWLSIDADTPKDVLGTAWFFRSAHVTARMADALGRKDDAERYSQLAADVAAAFRSAYVHEDGRIMGDTQTGYALALRFGLLTDEQQPVAVRHLAADIERRGCHLSTGFVGVAHLLPALTDGGRLDLAYRLALSESFPSWGYTIRQGATTMWERWDGWTQEHGFQSPEMNSFNHYAFGSVGEWLYSVVGGLRCHPDSAGWQRIIVEPRPGGGLTWARCRYDSVRGPVTCSWRLDDEHLRVDVEIPAGATAEIVLPATDQAVLTESGRPVERVQRLGRTLRLPLGSGTYHFLVVSDHAIPQSDG